MAVGAAVSQRDPVLGMLKPKWEMDMVLCVNLGVKMERERMGSPMLGAFTGGKEGVRKGCSLEQQLLGGARSQVLPPPAAWQELLSTSKFLAVGSATVWPWGCHRGAPAAAPPASTN